MAIFGFIVLFLILGWITFALIFLAFASSAFGGRSPNGGEVLGFLFVIILVGYGWYQLFLHSPFSISVK